MSGPIFVRDAQGTPLMPMAAAHARKLLKRGNVELQPHHAFTVVQLTRTVSQPLLQPVLLAIMNHATTAELFLLATGTRRKAVPLLYLVADVSHNALITPQESLHEHKRQQKHHVSIRQRASVLAHIIAALRELVPITWIGEVPMPLLSRSTLSTTQSQQILQRVRQQLVSRHRLHVFGCQQPLLNFSSDILSMLQHWIAEPLHHAPLFLSCVVTQRALARPQDQAPFSVRETSTARRSPRTEQPFLQGALCECRIGDRVVVGFLQAIRSTEHLIILTPERVKPTGITWQSVEIEPSCTVRIRSSERIPFLRIPHEKYYYDI